MPKEPVLPSESRVKRVVIHPCTIFPLPVKKKTEVPAISFSLKDEDNTLGNGRTAKWKKSGSLNDHMEQRHKPI